ncbi:hypothetical protein [Nostoc punctiforme]|uniref:Replication protein O n=1 Tax=Nostoc punctiforme (strain ATCC 29133 / PCC 73102) TaxID=63737 RepID=B2JBF2_NOSP7|nr:hypothetical protein [Nostoc punctiforme]ACC85256.1 conserved hypothetical protein [Nostoc punctiforme PCC 73102]
MSLSNNTKTLESRKNNKYAEILGSPIAFHRVYATIAGSASAGLFLSQAMYWNSRTNDPQGWFYKTYEQWTSETALNRYELDKIRHHLTTINILETQLKGSPARLYYRINHKVLNNFLDAIKKGSFTSIRPKNKNTKKYSQISESVDSQQTGSVCLPSTNLSAEGQQASPMTLNNPSCSRSTNSIYIESTEITSKITSEITHNAPLASLPAPPTQESVCEKEELDLTTKEIELEEPTPEKPSLEESTPEEPTPQQPTSLLKNSESLQQTDNPSRGSTIAAESFEKSEQANKLQLTCPYKTAQNVKELIDAWLTDPTAMSDDSLPLLVRETIKWNRWVLPWRNGERKLNNLYQNFNPVVVDFLAQELATKSKRSARQEIDHAIAVMNTWEKTKGGWTNLMQRYHQALQTEKQPLPQQRTALAHKVKNITSSSLEDALAQDRIRRQQEQSIQVPSNGYQHSPQMLELKVKLQAKANEPKVLSNTRPSSTNLREVEAQLKLALRA